MLLSQPVPMAEQAAAEAGAEPEPAAEAGAEPEPAAGAEPAEAANGEFVRPNRRLLVVPWQQVARNIDTLSVIETWEASAARA